MELFLSLMYVLVVCGSAHGIALSDWIRQDNVPTFSGCVTLSNFPCNANGTKPSCCNMLYSGKLFATMLRRWRRCDSSVLVILTIV